MIYISNNLTDTKRLAEIIAVNATSGFILLKGTLAAGKTTFTKYLAKALNIKQRVNSPTFVIMNQYEITGKNYNLIHIDAYRLSPIEDLGMLSENFDNNLVVIEWYEKLGTMINSNNILILEWEAINLNKRKIIISGTGVMFDKVTQALKRG